MSKEKIHRTFSFDHPQNRKKPRIFMFDCCSGQGQRSSAPRYQRTTARVSNKKHGEEQQQKNECNLSPEREIHSITFRRDKTHIF